MPNLVFRKVEQTDNYSVLYNLIYKTDPYLYRDLFGNFENAQILLSQLLEMPGSIFYRDNYYVAVLEPEIVGLAAFYKQYVKWDEKEMRSLFVQNGIEIPDSFEEVSQYFVETFNYISMGLNVCNICVSETMRNKGIAKFILENLIKFAGKADIELNVLKDNAPAVHLYEKYGFVIIEEFDDYGGYKQEKVKSLKMYRSGSS